MTSSCSRGCGFMRIRFSMTATVDKRAYQQLTAHLTAALRRIAELEATLELERGCHIRTERKLQDALKQSSQRLRELSLEYSSGPSGAAADAVWGNGQLVQHLQRLQPVAAAKSPTHRAGFSRPTATLAVGRQRWLDNGGSGAAPACLCVCSACRKLAVGGS